ncbi:MAG: hypothetical protein HY779_04730 [Rubrobacteridae bacterium]|nr:hypothetical protein [Rubrobacteridae bacterium]
MLFGRFIGIIIALSLILIGTVLLLSNLGIIFIDIFDLLALYWPIILILIGLYFIFAWFIPRKQTKASSERISVTESLEGAQKADIKIDFGAGLFNIKSLPNSSEALFEGSFFVKPAITLTRASDLVSLTLKQAQWPWFESLSHGATDDWQLGLTTRAALSLTLNTGASKLFVDLKENILDSLILNTGASDVTVRLSSISTLTHVMVSGGAANIRIEVPPSVAARITSTVVPASVNVDIKRFPQHGKQYVSTDFDSAAHKAEIEIKAGVSQVTVI